MNQFNLNTIGAQLFENARKYPEQDALVIPGTCRYSWQQLNQKVDLVAGGMLAFGVQPGMHIALWSPNCAEWVLTFLAASRLGAVIISLDTSLQASEIKMQLSHSDAAMLLMAHGVKSDEYIEIMNLLLPDLPAMKDETISAADFPKLQTLVLFGSRRPGFTSFDRLIERGAKIQKTRICEIAATVTADALVNIQYTSAAFGTPKGVMLSQSAILSNGAIAGTNLGFTHSDRLCLPLPFFHAFGCSLGLMLCLAHGATLVALESFTPEAALQAAADEKCTAMHGVPTMFLTQLETRDFSRYDLSSLRTGIMAGAPCPIDLMLNVIDKMNAREITIAYGQTEAGPLITQTSVSDKPEQRVASVGRPLSGVEVRIVDPLTGDETADGVEGELCARSAMLMNGYYKMPGETGQSLDQDGWLHTGDLAIKDASGCYRITGRMRNMIIRGGQNIYPAEVEACLLQHPAILQISVFGSPDRKFGEIVAARIVPETGQDVDIESLRTFCTGKIAHYKVPSSVEIVSSL